VSVIEDASVRDLGLMTASSPDCAQETLTLYEASPDEPPGRLSTRCRSKPIVCSKVTRRAKSGVCISVSGICKQQTGYSNAKRARHARTRTQNAFKDAKENIFGGEKFFSTQLINHDYNAKMMQ
jgi:hypothetical protein